MIMRYVGQPSHTTFKSDEHMDVSLAQKRTADLEWFEDTVMTRPNPVGPFLFETIGHNWILRLKYYTAIQVEVG